MTSTTTGTVEPPVDVWAEATAREVERGASAVQKESKRRITPMRRFLIRFGKDRVGVVAVAFLALCAILAIVAPWVTPHDPNAQNLQAILQYPNSAHWLGTDDLGRDVLSRLIAGTRVSLVAALQATLIAVIFGVPLGLISGFFGGWVDRSIMFVNDAIMAMPGLLLAIAIVGMLGPGLTNAMIAIGIVFVPRILRIVRGSVMEIKEETYIEASRSIGTPTGRIIRQHVLRNVRSPLIVGISLLTGRAMLNEASLSFLGLGAQYPESSWGEMLGRAFPFVDRAPFLIVFPGIAIALVVLAFNMAGDSLRDSLGRETRKS